MSREITMIQVTLHTIQQELTQSGHTLEQHKKQMRALQKDIQVPIEKRGIIYMQTSVVVPEERKV